MRIRPSSISFACFEEGGALRGFAEVVVDGLAASGLPPVSSWKNHAGASGDADDLVAAVSAFSADMSDHVGEPAYVQVRLGTQIVGSIGMTPSVDASPFCSVNLDLVVSEAETVEGMLEFQRCCLDLCRFVLERRSLYSAELFAENGGLQCLPDVPIVDGSSHVVVTSRDEVEQYYDDPDTFWQAGWQLVESIGERRLLAREMDVVCGPEYLARIIAHQWSMARAAAPGETAYDRPNLLSGEESVFNAGERRLESVGYDAEARVLEYSCAVQPGEHIQGWETFTLLHIVTSGELSDGSVVERVRVVFPDASSAEQEKRPLLDIGCEVHHYTDSGDLEQIVE